jgi:hypothetical protein
MVEPPGNNRYVARWIIEDWNTPMLRLYARMCARALPRAHARSGDAAAIAG